MCMMERRPSYSFRISLLVFHFDFSGVGFGVSPFVPVEGVHGTFSDGDCLDCLLCSLLPLLDLFDAVAAVSHAARKDTAETAALSLDAPAAEHEEECDD